MTNIINSAFLSSKQVFSATQICKLITVLSYIERMISDARL